MFIVPTERTSAIPSVPTMPPMSGQCARSARFAWFIVHDTEGYFAGDEEVLTSAAPPVESSHALIDRDGTLVAMVPLDRTAWTPGNDDVARSSINVELSGFATEPYTDGSIAASPPSFAGASRGG